MENTTSKDEQSLEAWVKDELSRATTPEDKKELRDMLDWLRKPFVLDASSDMSHARRVPALVNCWS